jgi:hypothetical protein
MSLPAEGYFKSKLSRHQAIFVCPKKTPTDILHRSAKVLNENVFGLWFSTNTLAHIDADKNCTPLFKIDLHTTTVVEIGSSSSGSSVSKCIKIASNSPFSHHATCLFPNSAS